MGLFSLFSTKKVVQEEKIISKEADFSSFKMVTDYIYEKSGITDLDTRALTASRMQNYAQEEGVLTSKEFFHKMQENQTFFQEVINIATVNETFFMREVKELEWLVSYIEKSPKKLKILSMPSSSGEEIYSILIMLSEQGVSLERLEFHGYDINTYAIKNAQDGRYEEHSLHKLDTNLRSKYFTQKEQVYTINPSIQRYVTFKQENIFELDIKKEKYDVVLSRNMFIYFNDEKRALALDIIVNLLVSDGVYIKGHADSIKGHINLEKIDYGIYKKRL